MELPFFLKIIMLKSSSIKIFLVITCFIPNILFASRYDFNENCKKAYKEIINLNFIQAKILIETEKKTNSDNLIIQYLNNTIDFLCIVISEDQDLFNTLKINKDNRIISLENGDTKSPYYRYCLAEVYLQWAASRIIFNDYVNAAYEINKAYRLLKKNQEEFPAFIPNFKSLGLLNSLIGSIPDNFKWIVKIIGIDGSLEQGVNQLTIVLKSSLQNDQYSYLSAESIFFLAYISLNLNNDRNNVLLLIKLIESNNEINNLVKTSALVNFGVSNLYLRTKIDNDKGINILTDFSPCKNCFNFNYRYYANGLARLNRLDKNADTYFNRFLKESKGQNFIKAAYQKLAWYYLINSDTLGYKNNMAKVKIFGKLYSDDDKQGSSEAESNTVPNIILLKSRLLFDGGYYQKALGLFEGINPKTFFKSKKDILEYYYRTARIYHEKGDTAYAKSYYMTTIKLGEDEIYYFAANACLQLGLIYESQKKNESAKVYFKKAMNLKNLEYRNSINQKAKAGLNRLK